jgi:hypothetical protein
LLGELKEMRAAMTAGFAEVNLNLALQRARSTNMTANSTDTELSSKALVPLPNAAGVLPAEHVPNEVWFPSTVMKLRSITSERADALLAFYGLPAIGVGAKFKMKKRGTIGAHIGVRAESM